VPGHNSCPCAPTNVPHSCFCCMSGRAGLLGVLLLSSEEVEYQSRIPYRFVTSTRQVFNTQWCLELELEGPGWSNPHAI
jgi:hypothetical protein